MGDHLLKLNSKILSTRRSLGVQNRMPQGQLVPFNFNAADVFDSTDTMDVFLSFPDRVYAFIEVAMWIMFREFFSAAKTAASSGTLTSDSGGGATSGSSSSSTTGAAAHTHSLANWSSNTPGGYTLRRYATLAGSFDLPTQTAFDLVTDIDGAGGHSHGMTHTHSTPNHQHTVSGHTHALTYGVFKETYPASHSVTLTIYELEAGAWVLRGTIAGLTNDIEELDLLPYINGSGLWRLTLKSAGGQPNGGRLGCDVAGHVLGAIQSA
jgi:hypothetical protein